jgi:hypothetical protein
MPEFKNFYTYAYSDPSRNNEIIYIGKGAKRRAWDHLKRKKMHPFIQRLQKMKRLGIEPKIEILAKDISEETAFSLEMWFIYKFGRKDLGKGTLLNLTDGGEGSAGYKLSPLSPEQLKKRSATMIKAAATPTAIANRLASSIGRIHSEETKQKMSASSKGKPKSKESCRKMSESRKGAGNHQFGKPLSNIQKDKISKANTGRIISKEWANKISQSRKGQISMFNPELNKWHWVNPNDVPKFLESGHRIGRK